MMRKFGRGMANIQEVYTLCRRWNEADVNEETLVYIEFTVIGRRLSASIPYRVYELRSTYEQLCHCFTLVASMN